MCSGDSRRPPATRYHSLLVDRATFPKDLEVTAETAEGEAMGLRHRTLPIWGVQASPRVDRHPLRDEDSGEFPNA